MWSSKWLKKNWNGYLKMKSEENLRNKRDNVTKELIKLNKIREKLMKKYINLADKFEKKYMN